MYTVILLNLNCIFSLHSPRLNLIGRSRSSPHHKQSFYTPFCFRCQVPYLRRFIFSEWNARLLCQTQGSLYVDCLSKFTLFLLWSDTGPAGRILGNIGALQNYQFHNGLNRYYRLNRSSLGQISQLLRLRKESYSSFKQF